MKEDVKPSECIGRRTAVKADVLERFAKRERLKMSTDECGDRIIRGRFGHFDDNHDGRIGVVLLRSSGHWKEKLKQFCAKEDPTCQVEGDAEAVFLAGPDQHEFLHAAIRALGVKRKRQVSPEQAQKQIARLREAREKQLQEEGALSPKSQRSLHQLTLWTS